MYKKLSLLLFLGAGFSPYAQNNGNVGIGTTTPLQKLHVEGTSFFNGNVGIGSNAPFAQLTFNNNAGEKVSFNGTVSNNFGIGIQLGLLQIHSNISASDIAFGYGSSNNLTERMRIINDGGYDGMILNGRLLLKNGSVDLVGGGGGVWLYKSDNTALLGFMGTQNNRNIGFYGGPTNGGWGFVYDAINSRVGIGTSNPIQSLHVEGTTFLDGNVGIGFSNPGHKLQVEGITFLNGSVGIGTFAGSESLKVNGQTLLDGFLEVSANASKPGGGPWIASSDARLKKNVLPYSDGLSTLLKIRPVTYHYNQQSGYDTKPEYVGVMAQDIISIAPYMVGSFQKKGETFYNVDNSAMTYMLINAVKEQQLMIDKQQLQIDELKKLVEKLTGKVVSNG
jgi:hypothetical protein